MSKGIAAVFLETGARMVGRAAGAVLSDPRGQEALARAVGVAQRSLQAFESVQERALHLAGFAARPDYQELRKHVARLKRKAREIGERLDAAERHGAAHPAEEPGGADEASR